MYSQAHLLAQSLGLAILLQAASLLFELEKDILTILDTRSHSPNSFFVLLLLQRGLEQDERLTQVGNCVVGAADVGIVALLGIVVGQ